MNSPRLTVLCSGMVAGVPHHGGATWAVLQYVLGLRELGHDVYFVEPMPQSAVLPAGVPLSHSVNAAYFRDLCAAFGLEQAAALLLRGASETVGLPYDRVVEVAERADILINVAGMLQDPNLTGRIPVRVYLDLDPAFTQLWQAAQGIDMGFGNHTHFVTVGLGIGEPTCPIPTCGLPWIPTLQPIVLSHWPVATDIVHDALTTVANWRGYGSIEYEGVHYGQKVHALRPLIDLPTRTCARFELALAIHPEERADLEALARNRWHLLDPKIVAGTPQLYRQFVQGSKAEFGIAKSGYVRSRCGWFSDRSVCYLASGRPVIAQDTGFGQVLPTGTGLMAFETCEDVQAAIASIEGDYGQHARAARAIAEEFFDANKVLSALLQRIGVRV